MEREKGREKKQGKRGGERRRAGGVGGRGRSGSEQVMNEVVELA